MAVYRQGDGEREQGGAAKKRPQQEPPVVESLLAQNTQADVGAKERHESLEVEGDFNLWLLVFSQEGFDARIVVLMRIDVAHDTPVTFLQYSKVHFRDYVRCAVYIITRHMAE